MVAFISTPLYQLIHFAHYMEAAFGFGLAFSLFEDIHGWGQNSYRRRKDQALSGLKSKIPVKEPKAGEDSRRGEEDTHYKRVESALNTIERSTCESMKPKVWWLKAISFVIGLIFYALLATVGYQEQFYVSGIVTLLIILMGAMPVLFMFYLYWCWNKALKTLESQIEMGIEMGRSPLPAMAPPTNNNG